MNSNIAFYVKLAIAFLPFLLFAFLNSRANVKKEIRCRQYPMPLVAILYSVVLLVFMEKLEAFLDAKILQLIQYCTALGVTAIGEYIENLYTTWGVMLIAIVFNTAALLAYVIVKKLLTVFFRKIEVKPHTVIGKLVECFYSYDERDNQWYIREHCGQARTFVKTAYYGGCCVCAIAIFISFGLFLSNRLSEAFYPVFAVIVMGEIAFFVDGCEKEERKSTIAMQADKARRVVMYPLLRNPLRSLFGDKLSAEGTTVNNEAMIGNAVEDVLNDLEKNGGHIGQNYAAFIRTKAEAGLKPDVDYMRCGYDLASGKSLLFNTPFYDKLDPYIFYAMNRELLRGRKIMVVLGRHGTEEDLYQWCENGMQKLSNIPDFWKISVLSGKKSEDEDLPDIGIISRSGVHDLDVHKNNLPFLKRVSFVVLVEPSRLVATAQVGLRLLVQNCGRENAITFCSVDRNCDGLVDALSHILMTNITEVSATEYPRGVSSYMYWTADGDYLQHRILPGVSRCLGMGTELSVVALKNQVKKTVWYGGEAYPVSDARWIAKQYYYDLLDYAQIPTNQETFDKCFQTSFNLCNERVSDYSFITVEDDRNNLFETRRNFATIAEQQGFVNVISSDYMLREYMAENPDLFTTDAKAIPYITADYARTKRNAVLSMCLLLCVDPVPEDVLVRQMSMLNIEGSDMISALWEEICILFCDKQTLQRDKNGSAIMQVRNSDGKTVFFEKKRTLLFKRAYSVETGKFESVYTIENEDFARIILDDLQHASYIAEQESEDVYIGTELKGHVYQKYMPGQFFTLNGKYYEMVSTTADNRILVRRASEHIGGRLCYRQVRNYAFHHIEDSDFMGELKTVNNIDIHYQFADFSVETPGYWKMTAFNDFENGDLITVNGVPVRRYHHKQILKFDFSQWGEAFSDEIRMTLTNLLNEVFITLFADNQPFISAITPGCYGAPLTYGLTFDEGIAASDKCIYIVEDSQLDIGLLIAVERNIKRVFQIISDYLGWNDEMIAESIRKQQSPPEEKQPVCINLYEEDKPAKKKGFFARVGDWFKRIFGKKRDKRSKKKKSPEVAPTEPAVEETAPADKATEVTVDETVPATEAAEPTADKSTPEAGEAEVVADEPAPEAEAIEPTTAEVAPEAETAEPVADEVAPEAETMDEAKTPMPPENETEDKPSPKAARAAARAERKAARQEKKLQKKQEKAARKQREVEVSDNG